MIQTETDTTILYPVLSPKPAALAYPQPQFLRHVAEIYLGMTGMLHPGSPLGMNFPIHISLIYSLKISGLTKKFLQFFGP